MIILAIAKFEFEEIGLFILATQLLHLGFVLFTNRLTGIRARMANKEDFKRIHRIFLSIFEVSPGIEIIKPGNFSFVKKLTTFQIMNGLKFVKKPQLLEKNPSSYYSVKNRRNAPVASHDISNISFYPITPKFKTTTKRVSLNL